MKFLLVPSGLITLGGISSLTLLCFRTGRKLGMRLGMGALLLYAIFGAGPVSFLLLGYLEYQVAPATAPERTDTRTIVVLTAHAEPDPAIPISSHVNTPSAFRILEVLRLFQDAPDSIVIVSGGGVVPKTMSDVLISTGVPASQIQIDGESLNTADSAKRLRPQLGRFPFLLVTSAGHMPRAIRAFQKVGMVPIAAPTHYMTRRNWLAVSYLPTPSHLQYSDLAVSEYEALLWYRLKGWI